LGKYYLTKHSNVFILRQISGVKMSKRVIKTRENTVIINTVYGLTPVRSMAWDSGDRFPDLKVAFEGNALNDADRLDLLDEYFLALCQFSDLDGLKAFFGKYPDYDPDAAVDEVRKTGVMMCVSGGGGRARAGMRPSLGQQKATLKFLHERGANFNETDFSGWSVRKIAYMGEKHDLVAFLDELNPEGKKRQFTNDALRRLKNSHLAIAKYI
jgi:hypothetical protein